MPQQSVSKKYILAIDQGTTGSRAFIFDHQGQVVSSAYQEFRQYYPKPGWVEHDALEIWASVEKVIRKAVVQAHINPDKIAAIGITNQRETTLLWDRRTGKPCHRAIVWQCRRTAHICQRLKKYAKLFQDTTGLVLDAYFSGTKVQWLLDHVPGLRVMARRGDVAFGTMDSWLIYKLTGGQTHATDMTNASRTLMFDITTRRWSPKLLKLLDVPKEVLPRVFSSSSVFGHTSGFVAGLPAGIPITGVMGDQQAALYGQGCTEPGMIKNTYGTGCFMLLNTGKKHVRSTGGLLTTLACDEKGEPVFALEGSVFIAGAVVQWLRDELKVITQSSQTESLIAGLKDTCGVYFVPAFAGLGAPYWEPGARGAIMGLTRGANVRHIVRAALESMAYQTQDIFDLMQKESRLKVKVLAVDGGACRNNFLMQFQADQLGIRVVRPQMVDSTVAGAAYLAGVSIGMWTSDRIFKSKSVDRIFKPCLSRAQADGRYAGWKKAVGQVLAGKE
ncbi:MAG: glycerol kinase GlpK [Candidatus Omnitrophica bacterium]|nr:glycerol kinase GlpK [Candidatus Omnitrophota bacterium]